jgi:hypothetical protein
VGNFLKTHFDNFEDNSKTIYICTAQTQSLGNFVFEVWEIKLTTPVELPPLAAFNVMSYAAKRAI